MGPAANIPSPPPFIVWVRLLYKHYLLLAARGAVLVTSLLFAALRAEHCFTPVAPLRGVPGFYGIINKGYIVPPCLNRSRFVAFHDF